jgi:hypothetical protein
VPATFVGLVLFVVFLTPGFTLLIVQEARRPKRGYSAIRETAVLLLAGVIFDLLALTLFAGIHLLVPSATPDVGRLIRDQEYLQREYDAVILWTVGLVTLASTAAAATGLIDEVPVAPIRRRLTRLRPIRFQSAWHKMFIDQLAELRRDDPRAKIHCTCILDDTSWIAGYLFSFNEAVEETQNRDLILAGEVTIGQKDNDAGKVLTDSGAVIVSAGRITVYSCSI